MHRGAKALLRLKLEDVEAGAVGESRRKNAEMSSRPAPNFHIEANGRVYSADTAKSRENTRRTKLFAVCRGPGWRFN